MSQNFVPIAKVKLSHEEINAALEVLNSGHLRQGEKTKEFEELFASKVGAKYAIAVSSGTAALHIAYLVLIKSGDEVLVPTFTHISTASMVCFAGGKPIFCDINPKTFTIDLDEIKRKITPKTKAIAPVHLFGNACKINEILEIARENNLKVIWDACQALGTKYEGKDVGNFDNMVCYSFYPTKNITTGEGGMIVTNDPKIAEKCSLLRNHGQTKKYYHTLLGFNYRMTDIEAAIGLEQLKKLGKFLKKRRENALYLTEELSQIDEVVLPFVSEEVEHSYHQYAILLDLTKLKCNRDEFVKALEKEGIGTGVHYPRPLHKQPVFVKMYGEKKLSVSEDIAKRILTLPVYPSLSKKELKNIVDTLKSVVSRFSKWHFQGKSW